MKLRKIGSARVGSAIVTRDEGDYRHRAQKGSTALSISGPLQSFEIRQPYVTKTLITFLTIYHNHENSLSKIFEEL